MKKINILFIGNSYSRNLETLMPILGKKLGVKINIANLYYGGCSLYTHYDAISNKKNIYEIDTFDFDKNTWTYSPNKTFEDIMALYKWDFVSLQQASIFSGKGSDPSWDYKNKLKKLVFEKINNISQNFKFIWHMTWPYAHNYPEVGGTNLNLYNKFYGDEVKMYLDIVNEYKKQIIFDNDFFNYFPSGHVIFELRYFYLDKELFAPDAIHLDGKISLFATALAAILKIYKPNFWAAKIFSMRKINLNINGKNICYKYSKRDLRFIIKAVKTSLKY